MDIFIERQIKVMISGIVMLGGIQWTDCGIYELIKGY